MIGVIGPRDSTDLALAVAVDEGLQGEVMVRVYDRVDEAPELARELDPVCQVLLFTGQVPYVVGRAAGPLRATTQFVRHSGADLYATLVRLLREFRGELPSISLDTIGRDVIREAYEDLGFEAGYVLPLQVETPGIGRSATEAIAAFHVASYRRGEVEVCVTCVGSVCETLVAAHVPARRISHTRSVMREALRHADLAARLAITEATQPAAVLVEALEIHRRTDDAAEAYEHLRRRQRMRAVVLDLAGSLHGHLADLDDGTFVVHTDRGAIDGAIARLVAAQRSPLEGLRRSSDFRCGIGLGATFAGAEENAQRALVMGRKDGDMHVAFADGEVLRMGGERAATTYQLRETDGPRRELARQLGLGPLALTRLTTALRQIDSTAFTAADLAAAYGIEARSARRLMTSMSRAGVVTRSGRQGGPRAGRPQTIYGIDLGRMVPQRSR